MHTAHSKGQLISKGNFSVSILPKMNIKLLMFALAYWGKIFRYFFGRIEKNKKALTKLTDLYLLLGSWPSKSLLLVAGVPC